MRFGLASIEWVSFSYTTSEVEERAGRPFKSVKWLRLDTFEVPPGFQLRTIVAMSKQIPVCPDPSKKGHVTTVRRVGRRQSGT